MNATRVLQRTSLAVLACGGLFLVGAGLIRQHPSQQSGSLFVPPLGASDHAGGILLPATGFTENTGQYSDGVKFARQTPASDLFVIADGRLVHAFAAEDASVPGRNAAWVVIESLVGGSAASIDGQVPVESPVSWFIGNDRSPRTFEAIQFQRPWPGIDLRLRLKSGLAERLFELAPHADPSQIRIQFDGIESWHRQSTGELILMTGAGPLKLSAPRAFQETSTGRRDVGARYVVRENPLQIGFELGPYDRSASLTIDPVLQSTFFGDIQFNAAIIQALTVDPTDGDLYVAGFARSNNLPALEGGYQVIHQTVAAFIARIDPLLRKAKQTTLFGGFSDEDVRAIAVHPMNGDIYIAGDTLSPDLPGRGGGVEPFTLYTSVDGYVARFSKDLRTLRQSTYHGGLRSPAALRGMAIHPGTGDIVTLSNTTANGLLITRLNPELTTRLAQRPLIGENGIIRGTSVAINGSTGDIYVGGLTRSLELPQLAGAARSTIALPPFGESAFVARYDADLATHLQTTYSFDVPAGAFLFNYLAIDPQSGEVYSVGQTGNAPGLPVVNGAQSLAAGGHDVFIARFSADLRSLLASTFFGGTDEDLVLGIVHDPPTGGMLLVGSTFSTNLPATAGGAIPPDGGFGPDGYVTRLNRDLSSVTQTSYFIGFTDVRLAALTVHPDTDEIYLGGFTGGSIPETTGGLQEQQGDAFISRLDSTLRAASDTTPDAFAFVDHFGVSMGSIVTSAPVRIEGITLPTLITIQGGEYSVAQGEFQSGPGTVLRGQSVRVRHIAALAAGTTTDSVLTIGSVSDTFRSITQSGNDSQPNAFAFPVLSPAVPDILVISEPTTIGGINAPAAISISAGEYSVDGGPFTSLTGTVHGGQSIMIRQRTSAQFSTLTDSVLNVGGASAVFRTVTDPVDDVPHAFSILDRIDVSSNADIDSDPAAVDGMNVPVPISISGGEYSVHSGPYTSATGMISPFDYFTVRVHTGAPGTTAVATVTIGGLTDEFSAATTPAGDGTPNAFDFLDMSVQADGGFRNLRSNDVTITGIDHPVSIVVENAQYFDSDRGLYFTSGKLRNGQTTHLQLVAPPNPGDLYISGVTIGGVTDTVRVRANGDLSPNPFDFLDQTSVTPGTQVVSNVVTIAGVDGPVDATVTNCQFSINGNEFTSSPALVRSGDRIQLRITAPATGGQSSVCTVSIGGVTDTFRVTTAGGGGGGGGGGGSSDPLALLAVLLIAAGRRRAAQP